MLMLLPLMQVGKCCPRALALGLISAAYEHSSSTIAAANKDNHNNNR